MAYSPQDLMAASKCLACIPPGKQDAVIIYLLCILAQGGGGGGGGLSCGAGDPTLPPVGTCGLYYNFTSGTLWYWNSSTLAWVQITTGSGGGVECGIVNPTLAPGSACTLYYNTANGSLFYWSGAAWVALIQ